jgi:hypothetical protein
MNLRLLPVPLAAILAFAPGCSSKDAPGGAATTPPVPDAAVQTPAVDRNDKDVTKRLEPERKDDSKDAPASKPADEPAINAPGDNDSKEFIPSTRGRNGDRFGSRMVLGPRGAGTPPAKGDLLAALRWLARHQSPDGRWSSDGFGAACRKKDGTAGCGGAGDAGLDVGVTGLALLSFLGAGFNHVSDTRYDGIRFGDVVQKGQQWLVSQQGTDGCIAGKETSKYMINHAIAALALCEAYGLITSDKLRDPATRAIGFIVQAQNSGQGWRYAERSGDSDTFVTGWCVMALKSA